MKKEDLLRALKNNEMQSKIEKFGGISGNLKMPSVPTMLNNLKNSIINNAKSVAGGNALGVSDSDANARLNICKTCEFFNQLSQRCSKCGCKMAIKTYLKAEKCPVGKW